MMGNPTKSVSQKKDDTLVWVGVAVLIVFLLFTSTCYCHGTSDTFVGNVKSGFDNIVESVGSGSGGLKEMDVVYFMSPTCPWCQKMSKMLEDNSALGSVTVVNVNSEEGQKQAREMGAGDKGVPAFVSKKMKTGTVGFKPTIKELVDSLSKKGPQPGPQQGPPPVPNQTMDPNQAVAAVQDLQIVLFTSPTCGWCNKLKTELSEAGVLEMTEAVDVSTEQGKQVAAELIKEFRGVPAMVSRKTGKSVVGYKPLGDIIEKLS
jgi:glutaredoxin